MYRNKFFSMMKNIVIIMLFFWLRERGYVNNWGFVLGAIGTILAFSILAQRFKVRSTMKNLRELKDLSTLIAREPDRYFEEVDKLIAKSSGYERDYLILHKANTLAKINRHQEAIDLLLNHHPRYLDTQNQGVYYNNLLGLLVQVDRLKDAQKIYKEYGDILEENFSSPFAYSIYTNLANLKYRLGQKKEAQELLDKALASTSDEATIKNIEGLRKKM